MEMFKLVYQNAVTTEGLKVEVFENHVYTVMLNIEDEKITKINVHGKYTNTPKINFEKIENNEVFFSYDIPEIINATLEEVKEMAVSLQFIEPTINEIQRLINLNMIVNM